VSWRQCHLGAAALPNAESLCRDRTLSRSQDVFLNLAGRSLGKFFDEGDAVRRFAVAGAVYRSEPDWRMVAPMAIATDLAAIFLCGAALMRPATAQRFIFFTGHRNNPAIEFFFKRVNATVLIKPFNLNALDSTIRDVLRKLV
jgi:hypothetical protein